MTFTIRALLSVFSTLLLVWGISIQAQDRILTKQSWHNEPIKVIKVKVKGKEVKLDEKFAEEEDWLRGLTINVKNTSVGKTIVFIEFILDLSEASEEDSGPAWTIFFGQPSTLAGTPIELNKQKVIMPGENVDLTLSNTEYDNLRDFLNDSPKSIRMVNVTLGQVIFDDGTRWSAGKLWRRNPADPDVWKPVEDRERATYHLPVLRIKLQSS